MLTAGGKEFTKKLRSALKSGYLSPIILPNTDQKMATCVATAVERCMAKLDVEHAFSPTATHVTVSIGGATTLPGNRFIARQLLEKADQMLYLAKSEGRNTLRLFDFSLTTQQDRNESASA